MEISKPLGKLILDALQETNGQGVHYEATAREVINRGIEEEGVTAKRYWFIDDEEKRIYIRATQYQASPLLETVDILEQIRIHDDTRAIPYTSYQEYELAYRASGMREPEWPLLENFYKQFRKKDHQLLAKFDRNNNIASVALVIKDEDNMFLFVKFTKWL